MVTSLETVGVVEECFGGHGATVFREAIAMYEPRSVIILGRAIDANSSPMAHENMTNGSKWPVKILDGAKFYPDCAEIKKVIFQFSIQACCEKLSRVNICTRIVLSKLDSKVYF